MDGEVDQHEEECAGSSLGERAGRRATDGYAALIAHGEGSGFRVVGWVGESGSGGRERRRGRA